MKDYYISFIFEDAKDPKAYGDIHISIKNGIRSVDDLNEIKKHIKEKIGSSNIIILNIFKIN